MSNPKRAAPGADRRHASARDVFLGATRTPEAQRELEERFFAFLRMPDGTFKTTAPGRLGPIDDLIVRHLPRKKVLRVLDVGVASGVTTVELIDRLRGTGADASAVAIDHQLRAELVPLGSWADVLLSRTGDVLQVRLGRLVRPRPQGSNAFKRAVLAAAFQAAKLAASMRSERIPIDLITAEANDHPHIQLVEHDVRLPVKEWEGRFDIVRAANVLNRSYFSEPDLARIIANLSEYLVRDGILAITRTPEWSTDHDGSVFRRTPSNGQFMEIDTVGAGSEIADLVSQDRT